MTWYPVPARRRLPTVVTETTTYNAKNVCGDWLLNVTDQRRVAGGIEIEFDIDPDLARLLTADIRGVSIHDVEAVHEMNRLFPTDAHRARLEQQATDERDGWWLPDAVRWIRRRLVTL